MSYFDHPLHVAARMDRELAKTPELADEIDVLLSERFVDPDDHTLGVEQTIGIEVPIAYLNDLDIALKMAWLALDEEGGGDTPQAVIHALLWGIKEAMGPPTQAN